MYYGHLDATGEEWNRASSSSIERGSIVVKNRGWIDTVGVAEEKHTHAVQPQFVTSNPNE